MIRPVGSLELKPPTNMFANQHLICLHCWIHHWRPPCAKRALQCAGGENDERGEGERQRGRERKRGGSGERELRRMRDEVCVFKLQNVNCDLWHVSVSVCNSESALV